MRNLTNSLIVNRRTKPAVAAAARAGVELLESRQLLSADPAALAASGFEPVTWNGQQEFAKRGQWIVRVDAAQGRPEARVKALNAKLDRIGGEARDLRATRFLADAGGDDIVLVESPKAMKHGQVKAAVKNLPGLRDVEPDFAVWAEAAPNDTYFGLEWGSHNTGQSGGAVDADVDAPEAWDVVTARGAGVIVGVIDSGVDYNHPDLAAHIWVNPGEVAADGVDNDGNGYIDDVRGWDFANNDNDPMDDNGHGTHVAGTIGAVSDNAQGIAGVSDATVIPLKFLAADGAGSTSGAIAAINYATKLRGAGVNVRLTNNSWGGGGGYSSSLYTAIKASGDAGLMFVAAAGNGGADWIGDNNDLVPAYPASYNLPNVVAVAATDRYDNLASFSNFGATSVHLAAPGVDIASTVPGGGYSYMSGTSMAAPHVAGVAALLWGANPAATVAQARTALLNGTDSAPALNGKTATNGRLNANSAVRLLAAPAAPSSLVASAVSPSQVNLTWRDNATNETSVTVDRSTDGGATFAPLATLGANATGYNDAGLTAGVTYVYRVRAANAAGNSGYSNTASATPVAAPTVPLAPAALGASPVSASQIRFAWEDRSTNESGFKVERSIDGRKWAQVATTGAGTVSFVDSGLRKSTVYSYRVRAFNSVGNSAYSAVASARTLASGTATTTAATVGNVFSSQPVVASFAADDGQGDAGRLGPVLA